MVDIPKDAITRHTLTKDREKPLQKQSSAESKDMVKKNNMDLGST